MLFLANENFPLESIRKLRKAGYDVVSVSEDSPGIEDKEILFRARKENRIILTFDKGYGNMIYQFKMPIPKGIVLFRFDPASPDEPYQVII
jgi:predicted nuclease of predicted toxin-antitoxin system